MEATLLCRFTCNKASDSYTNRYRFSYDKTNYMYMTRESSANTAHCLLSHNHTAVYDPLPSAEHQYHQQGEKIPPVEHGSIFLVAANFNVYTSRSGRKLASQS